MTDNVVDLDAPFYGEMSPETVLEASKKEGLKQVVVLGTTEKGEVYFASSTGSRERIVYLLKLCEYDVLSGAAGV